MLSGKTCGCRKIYGTGNKHLTLICRLVVFMVQKVNMRFKVVLHRVRYHFEAIKSEELSCSIETLSIFVVRGLCI